MKRAHSPWIVILLATVAGTSTAEVDHVRGARPGPEPIAAAGVPIECRQFLAIPRDSTSELLPWWQRLSVAACRQEITLAPVSEPEQFRPMIIRLEQAMAPSIAMFSDALSRGPRQVKILAAYGLGMANVNIIVRARSAVRIAAGGAWGGASYGAGEVERSQRLRASLDALLVRERNAALAAFRELARQAHEDPGVAKANAVMSFVVADAERQSALLR